LRPRANAFVDRLWNSLQDATADDNIRFRAGLALACYAPKSDRWASADEAFIARTLLAKGIERQRELRADLQPIALRLLPEIFSVFRDQTQHIETRAAATGALAEWAVGEPRLLATAVCEATADQFLVLLPTLSSADRTEVVATLRQIVVRQPPVDESFTESDRVSLGRRRAAAAIALLRLDEHPLLPRLFSTAEDPEAQTQFAAGVRARGVDPLKLVATLQQATSETVRLGLVLALGEYTADELPEPTRSDLIDNLDQWYRTDASSAIHSACGWLLRTWRQGDRVHAFDWSPHSADFDPRRQWFLVQVGEPVRTGMSLTMISFPAGEFLMGSPPAERDRQMQETQHRVKLTRPFAMADRPISRALYVRFLEEARGPTAVNEYVATVRETSPTARHPAVGINWYDAVLFARWLTAEVGLSESEQCYADPATLTLDSHGHPVDRQWPFYPERKGFRLPTEAEWEYACRAGTVTTFSFGSDPTAADVFGWFQGNSSGNLHPTLPLKPTGRGLVSMHGNAAEWCHDWYGFIPGGRASDPLGISDGSCRSVRSGSYQSGLALSRSASRAGLPPEFSAPCAGLRLVRTLVP
jgi:formylglycine-generating enzyme required for sulfatase activity